MPDEEKKPSKLTKKQKILIACASGFVALLIIVLVIVLCLNKPAENDQDQAGPDSRAIDYSHKVVGAGGEEVTPTYILGKSQDLQIRFADLSCADEECSNVSTVQLDDKILVRGEDYQVTKGSVIITILNKILSNLKVGEYSIAAKINDVWVGVKIRIDVSDCTNEQSGCQSNDNTSEETNENSNTNEHINEQPNTTNEQQPGTSSQPNEPSQPTPIPEPIHTAEFNLNDGYKVAYSGVQIYTADENGNPIVDENNSLVDYFVYGSCEIKEDFESAVIKTTYFTSLSHGISLEQREAERAVAEARITSGYHNGYGTGYTVDLTEQFCDICGISCDRW